MASSYQHFAQLKLRNSNYNVASFHHSMHNWHSESSSSSMVPFYTTACSTDAKDPVTVWSRSTKAHLASQLWFGIVTLNHWENITFTNLKSLHHNFQLFNAPRKSPIFISHFLSLHFSGGHLEDLFPVWNNFPSCWPMPMLHITWASLPDLDNVTFAKDD